MLQEELLGFKSLKDIYSRAALAKVVNKLLTRYNIAYRIILITINNTSNNRTIIIEINRFLEEAFANICFLDRQIQYIPCLSHMIQLALKELFGIIRL